MNVRRHHPNHARTRPSPNDQQVPRPRSAPAWRNRWWPGACPRASVRGRQQPLGHHTRARGEPLGVVARTAKGRRSRPRSIAWPATAHVPLVARKINEGARPAAL